MENNQNPLSKSYFFQKITSKQYVHFTEDETICEYCHDLKKLQNPLSLSDLEEKKKLEEHLKRWHHQGLFFKKRKQEMVKK